MPRQGEMVSQTMIPFSPAVRRGKFFADRG
jgi:hypothetical protein